MMLITSPATQSRLRRLVLPLLVLMLGIGLYAYGFVDSLPYHFDVDEPLVRNRVNHLYTTGTFLDHYSPLGLIEMAGQQGLLLTITPDELFREPTFYLFARYFSVLHGALLLALAYQVGKHLHSPAVGMAAMLYFMSEPSAVQMVKIAKTDMLAWMFSMMSLWLAVRYARRDRLWLLGAAFGVALLAVLSKYVVLPVVIFAGMIMILYAPRSNRQRMIVVGSVFIASVLVLYIVANPPDAMREFLLRWPARQLYNRPRVFTFVSLPYLVPEITRTFGTVNLAVIAIGLPLALWLPRRRLDMPTAGLAVALLIMLVLNTLLLSLFDYPYRVHYRFVTMIGLGLLWALALGALTWRGRSFAPLAAVILLAPPLWNAYQVGVDHHKPDTRAMTADYFIEHVPEGTHLVVEYDIAEFEGGRGGYSSDKIFWPESTKSMYDESLESYALRGVEYIVVDQRAWVTEGFYDHRLDRDHTPFLSVSDLVLDLDITDPARMRPQGPRRQIYRIPTIQQNPTHLFMGGNALIFKGYDLSRSGWQAGETLDLVLYWAAVRETDANYTVFAQVLAEDGTLVAQLDALPGDALHRTYDWYPGYFDWDEWPVELPVDLAPGEYRLVVGMYDADTLARLEVIDPDGTVLGDHIELQTITISN